MSGAGISTAINGGNFWENLAISGIIVGANHLMDKGGDEEPKKLAPNPTVEINITVPEQGFRGIQTDYTIESVFIPIGQGFKVLGKGLGTLGSVLKVQGKMGGASEVLNYYTVKAMNSNLIANTAGRVKAPWLVQLNHNISRLFRSNFNGSWKTLYSNNAATIQGRAWQNEAIIVGGTSTTVGGFMLYKNLKQK